MKNTIAVEFTETELKALIVAVHAGITSGKMLGALKTTAEDMALLDATVKLRRAQAAANAATTPVCLVVPEPDESR